MVRRKAVKPEIVELSFDLVHQLFEYRDGDLYWKPSKAGTIDGSGYVQTGIRGKYFKNHRIIFLMHHGYLPDVIDHIDGNRTNNHIENLREATRSENLYNSAISSKNTSGAKGVTYIKRFNKWRVRLYAEKKMYHIGYFDSLEEATKASDAARALHHKNFARKA